ncbi:ATP11-domain-containing protein, partial [Auriscalpium vulgare]
MLRRTVTASSQALRHRPSYPTPPYVLRRSLNDYAAKYARKLEERAQKEGVTVDDLRIRLKEEERERAKDRLAKAAEAAARTAEASGPSPSSPASQKSQGRLSVGTSLRQDSSPVKPLSSILNLDRLLQTPHTSAQVSALWTAFHASRSGGTGRGFICASVPRQLYDSLLEGGQKYKQFVIPIPRANPEDAAEKSYEFFVLQWDVRAAPPTPVAGLTGDMPFLYGTPPPAPSATKENPRTATIIFTPLLEYKQRQSFATPYFVLTFYSDLASSHDLVLMRGEITPAAARDGQQGGSYLLSQQDAQMLAMGMQKFYVWNDGEKGAQRRRLLEDFHERPEDFQWSELLKHAGVDS